MSDKRAARQSAASLSHSFPVGLSGVSPNVPVGHSISPLEGLAISPISLDMFFESQADGSSRLCPSTHVGHQWFLGVAESYRETFLTYMRDGRYSECTEIATALAYKLLEKGAIYERKLGIADFNGAQWSPITGAHDARDLVFRALLTLCTSTATFATPAAIPADAKRLLRGPTGVSSAPAGIPTRETRDIGRNTGHVYGSEPRRRVSSSAAKRKKSRTEDISSRRGEGYVAPNTMRQPPPKMRFKRHRDIEEPLDGKTKLVRLVSTAEHGHSLAAQSRRSPVASHPGLSEHSRHRMTEPASSTFPHIHSHSNARPPSNGYLNPRAGPHHSPRSELTQLQTDDRQLGGPLVALVHENDVICGRSREDGVLHMHHLGNLLFNQHVASMSAAFLSASTSNKGTFAMDAVNMVHNLAGRFLVKAPDGTQFVELSLEEARWRAYWALEKHPALAAADWESRMNILPNAARYPMTTDPLANGLNLELSTGKDPMTGPVARMMEDSANGQEVVNDVRQDGKASPPPDHTEMFRHIPTHLTFVDRVENQDRVLFPVTVRQAASQDDASSQSGEEANTEPETPVVQRDARWEKADRLRRRREKFERARALLSARRSQSPDPFADIAQMRADAVKELKKRQERTDIRKRLATWDPQLSS